MLMSKNGVAAAVLCCVTGAAGAYDSSDMLPFALMGGTPALDVRVRSEHSDNESATQTLDSNATTLRARLGFTTGKWNDLDAMFEYEGVTAFDKLDYNSTTNGQTARPAVGDPAGSEMNQAWVRYSGIPKTTLTGGRQRLLLDNQRWVGNVGWRQNEQTYTGAVLVNKGLPGTELTYAFFHDINSVFFTTFALKANLANASWSPGAYFKGTVYSYWLDFQLANTGNRQDSRTTGVRVAGTPALNEDETVKLLYTAEFARQGKYEESSPAANDQYLLGELGGIVDATTLKLGYEVLGSNDGLYAVQTPLATLHAHDGWDDMFLTTPATGLRRTFASLSSTLVGITGTAVAHRFEADFGGADYGDEYDASLGYAFNRQLSGLVKYAKYDAKETPATTFATNVDTEKGWLQLEYKF